MYEVLREGEKQFKNNDLSIITCTWLIKPSKKKCLDPTINVYS